MAKTTKKEMYASIIAFLSENGASAEMLDFCNHEVELLNSRAGALKKPSKKDIAGEALANRIIEFLSEQDTPQTIPDIIMGIAGTEEVANYLRTIDKSALSNQSVNAMLIKLRGAKAVKRTYVEKHKAAFEVGAEPDEGENAQ